LLKQDRTEAVQNVEKRLEFIQSEMYVIPTPRDKRNIKKEQEGDPKILTLAFVRTMLLENELRHSLMMDRRRLR